MEIPHKQVEALLHDASERKIMPLWQNLRGDDVTKKTPDEIVTIADSNCESFLMEHLPNLLDGSLVIGEESVHKNPNLLSALFSDAPVWIIDPLDGTGNFVSGKPPIAIMVCLIHCGVTLGAWVLNPISGILTSAEKGSGAFEGSTRLEIEPSFQPLSNLRGALLTKFLPDSLRPVAEAASNCFLCVERTKCAGYDYNAFAKNEMQFLFYYRTLVWDHAPGILIAEEAGGFVRRLDGTEYTPTDTRKGLLCASSKEMWEVIQKTLVPTISVIGSDK
jgi:fructose-1,6-bisphosphatase/inositol monophosphatase family enzyme